jgi:hypothetical protein
MVKVGDMYIDGYLKSNYDIAKDVIKKDWDMIFAVDGAEGSGKSVLAMQGAYYLDNTFNIDRVCFTPDEFKNAVGKAKKYQAIVYDEAMKGLNSRQALFLINITLIHMLAEIRQKNLFIFIVLPCFFELDKYVAIWRSRALLHVYTGKNFERGRFAFFNYDKKKKLYVSGKKTYSYSKPPANFIGKFTNYYPIDEKEYRKRKHSSLVKPRESYRVGHTLQRNALFYYLHKELGFTQREIADGVSKFTRITPNLISYAVKSLEKRGLKHGGGQNK